MQKREKMKSIYDIEYKNGLCLDIHLPEDEEYDLFVYFHGGGLVKGSRGGVEPFASTLAKRGIATASVEYRMYPEAKFPDYLDDCAESVAWLRDNISAYGKCGRIFAGGSSAGGYISMMLCFDKHYFAKVGMKPTDIAAYIHDAGQPTAHFNVIQKELGVDGRRVIVNEMAPIYFVGMDEEYSNMLFLVSDNDMEARYEQTILMVKTLQHFGHGDKVEFTLQHGGHCQYVYEEDENGEGRFGVIILEYLEKAGLI